MGEAPNAILIKEEMIHSGVPEDVAAEARTVFYTVRRYINPRTSFVLAERYGTRETDPKRLSQIAANTMDCLRVLEEYGFVAFRNGRYELTEKGKLVK